MTDHNHDHTVTAVAKMGTFNGGPLDGSEFTFWLPPDVRALQVTVAVEGEPHEYVLQEVHPSVSESGLTYLGVAL